MGARELLADLTAAGLSVAADGDRLVIRPASRLTDAMRATVRDVKADLLALLKPTETEAPTARIYRLTHQQADAAHAAEWGDPIIAAFTARRDALLRRGYGPDDADDLAERLALRDAEGDDRRMCVECSYLGTTGRCGAAGRLSGVDRRLEPVQTILQRCEAFRLRDELQPSLIEQGKNK